MEGGEIMSNSLNKTLYINDIALSDYNIYCSSDTYLNAPQIDYTEYQIPARTGTLIQYNKRLNNVIRNFSCICRKEDAQSAIDELKKLLYINTGYVKLASDYEPTYYQYGYFAEELEINYIINEDVAIFDLIFSCNPRKYENETHTSVLNGVNYSPALKFVNYISDENVNEFLNRYGDVLGFDKNQMFVRFEISYTGEYESSLTLDWLKYVVNGTDEISIEKGFISKPGYLIPFLSLPAPSLSDEQYSFIVYTPLEIDMLQFDISSMVNDIDIIGEYTYESSTQTTISINFEPLKYNYVQKLLIDNIYNMRLDLSVYNFNSSNYEQVEPIDSVCYFYSNEYVILFDKNLFYSDINFRGSLAPLIENDSRNELHLYFDFENQDVIASTYPRSESAMSMNKFFKFIKINDSIYSDKFIFTIDGGKRSTQEGYFDLNFASGQFMFKGWKL